MLDFGASINVMPYSVYQALNLDTLQDTNVIIQLTDRSYVRPMGIVEDVLVKVNNLLFPVDFYILKMETEGLNNPASILLGRPFMKTAKTKIDVDEGTLSVEFDGKIVKFKISEAMKYPKELQALYQIDVVDSVVHDVLEEELVGTELDLIMDLVKMMNVLNSLVKWWHLPNLLAPILKLKALPDHLQSLYLGVRETSSASIFNGLLKEQDELKLHEEVWRGGKEKTKRFHDFMRVKKKFEVGKKALFYKPRIKLTLAKLQNLDMGNSFPYDEFEISTMLHLHHLPSRHMDNGIPRRA
ncbi:UNVERIFIED_CONTAM: hypothetical protein Slati_3014200 [Sesamum latifolium]|uniref:Uncharacterized protein n=1 Tax=Sesamum latifolium TaxID=2727402 RepID=A0AAW2VF69_9LAMI